LAFSAPHDRLNLEFAGGYHSRPSVNFFGLGNDSLVGNKSEVRTVNREVAVGLAAQLTENWKAGLYTGYRNVGVTHSRSDPSTQLVSWDHEIPGLYTGALVRSALFTIERNTKDKQHLGSRGGIQHAEISLHEGVDQGDFSYWKYSFAFQQFFPISEDGRKVVAIRGTAETNQEKGGSQIPFFDLATLGSSSTIRGFQSFRFHDKSALSLGVEYRYRIWTFFDWAVFLDQGQVAPEPGDFGLDRFHTGYGIRFIARATPQRAVTIDVGRSSEGFKLYIDFTPAF
jgi:outer membrane protein assembly factor BamA